MKASLLLSSDEIVQAVIDFIQKREKLPDGTYVGVTLTCNFDEREIRATVQFNKPRVG